jgi:hypothetical protein
MVLAAAAAAAAAAGEGDLPKKSLLLHSLFCYLHLVLRHCLLVLLTLPEPDAAYLFLQQ